MSQTKLFIIAGIAVVAVIGLLLYLVLGNVNLQSDGEPITLQFWGVFDSRQAFDVAITEYQKINKNVRIVYRQLNFEDYEKELINSFAATTGPDIWMIHNTWVPKHGNKISALPQAGKEPLPTLKNFQDQFVDVTASDLISNGLIAGLPLYVDTLALYYNKDLFNSAGISSPPATWEEFNTDVGRLTALDNKGNILKAGAAIGTARNINRSTDILMLLMLQSGVKMTGDNNFSATFAAPVQNQNIGEVALQYYTDFSNPTKKSIYTWNGLQHYSIDAFTNGESAMMFNYSHHIPTIRDKAARFNFGVAPMPQIVGSPVKVNYANYWAVTVSKSSPQVLEAWKFLTYLTSKNGITAYLQETGRPPARRDLVEEQKNKPDIGVFAEQSLSARSWYQVDNAAIEGIFADMIDDVNFGRRTISEALKTAESQVNVLMRRARE
ncbi:MAG: extracellular solute-binding protein [bacterium]|nr:extracellular solute-binding protein [bacterium]